MKVPHNSNQRILALDISRGVTIAGMILVNNPGGHRPMPPYSILNGWD
jgi:predicted acyltransferase